MKNPLSTDEIKPPTMEGIDALLSKHKSSRTSFFHPQRSTPSHSSSSKSSRKMPLSAVTSIIDGLKKFFIEKLKPLEAAYWFNDFVSPALSEKRSSNKKDHHKPLDDADVFISNEPAVTRPLNMLHGQQ
ncbi:hypothetical protein Tsubulata_027760 [Turnera subulata]|uniref:EH domain-containing protein n=1 Tax=Turnera subulata TaxID=218843 RepID=A0A9Q0JLV7_9ROSI|nr:hypothetical protein Tsubulata_027760 [Turnera subulata]